MSLPPGLVRPGLVTRQQLLLAAKTAIAAGLAWVAALAADPARGRGSGGRRCRAGGDGGAATLRAGRHLSAACLERGGRRRDAGGVADAGRLAVGKGADGRGHLRPGQAGECGGKILHLREEVAVPDVDERDGLAALPGEER